MKLVDIILEASFYTYEAMAQGTYSEKADPKEIADLIRALPGVTTVTQASSDQESGNGTYKIKIISQKQAKEAFVALRKNVLSKYSQITEFTVAENTIEEK